MNIDFDVSDTTAPVVAPYISFGLWDGGIWDASVWGSGGQSINPWLGVTGIGYCGGLQMRTASSGISLQWASTDVVYQTGWAGI